MVRMPEGMRDRIAESAKANNRSMNSEIIAMLELAEAGTQLSDAALQQQQSLNSLVNSLMSVLSMTAHYLREVAAMVPRESASTKELMDNIELYAQGIQRGNFGEAVASLQSVAELGKTMGILDPETGRTKPEYAHLLKPLPTKEKS